MIHQQDILEEILSRLPAKSIGRFRCVSKPWKSLLSQPSFIKTHLNRTKHLPPTEEQSLILVPCFSDVLYSVHLNYTHQMTTPFATELKLDDHKFNCEKWELLYLNIASCDGLILAKDEDHKMLLTNPTTREIKVLPTSPYALNPRHSCSTYGLGYDAITDDYKVVMVSYYEKKYVSELQSDEDDSDIAKTFVNVYSVKNGTWKRAESSPYDHRVVLETAGVFVDGHIHWLARKAKSNSSVIAAFNLQEEEFHQLPPPSSVDGKKFVSHRLLELEGRLCMFLYRTYNWSNATDAWIMKEYNVKESWTKLFSITGSVRSDFMAVIYSRKEQVVLVKDDRADGDTLMMYNSEDVTFKEIKVQGIPDGYRVGPAYLESLVSPHHGIYSNDQSTRDE